MVRVQGLQKHPTPAPRLTRWSWGVRTEGYWGSPLSACQVWGEGLPLGTKREEWGKFVYSRGCQRYMDVQVVGWGRQTSPESELPCLGKRHRAAASAGWPARRLLTSLVRSDLSWAACTLRAESLAEEMFGPRVVCQPHREMACLFPPLSGTER